MARADAAVDTMHGASMLALAIVSTRYRRAALTSAASAAASALASVRVAREAPKQGILTRGRSEAPSTWASRRGARSACGPPQLLVEEYDAQEHQSAGNPIAHLTERHLKNVTTPVQPTRHCTYSTLTGCA